MRRSSVLFHLLGAVGVVGLLSACSGGGSDGTTPVAAPATPTVSSGTITAFGSVYINGTKYEIDDSTSTSVDGSDPVKGDKAAKSILRKGMVVKVSGTASGSSRMASTITHTDTLEGPIQTKVQVDANNGTLTILGQTVVVDDTTKFDDTIPPTTLTSLAVGNVVEVSGFVKSDGTIAASFIERKAGAPTDCSLGCEIKGIVTGHNHATTTFQIGGLTVDYETADIKDMPVPRGSNWVNLFVEVKGTGLAGATLFATKVEPEGFQAPDGNEVELEGFVTSVSGAGQFTLGTTQVQAANAVYLGGTIDEVAVGQKLEVEGTISGNVITASKVKFQDAVRLEGDVVSIPTANTLMLDGLPDITVSVVTGQTELKNVANLAGITVGNNVRIRGRQGAGNTVIATEVEFRNAKPDSKVTLQGVVQSPLIPPSITILGTTIDTSGLQLQGTDDVLINSPTFFSAVKPDTTIVKAKGTLPGPVWKEVELESD
jgi:cytoskeletal protein CcmA (bactofilin family)